VLFGRKLVWGLGTWNWLSNLAAPELETGQKPTSNPHAAEPKKYPRCVFRPPQYSSAIKKLAQKQIANAFGMPLSLYMIITYLLKIYQA